MTWEPRHISREDVVAKVLELAARAGYVNPEVSSPCEGSDPSDLWREASNLTTEIEIEFKLWSPGEGFNIEKDAPFSFSDEELEGFNSDEELEGFNVIGDLIDPLGKYIRKSYDAHAAWERDHGTPASWVEVRHKAELRRYTPDRPLTKDEARLLKWSLKEVKKTRMRLLSWETDLSHKGLSELATRLARTRGLLNFVTEFLETGIPRAIPK